MFQLHTESQETVRHGVDLLPRVLSLPREVGKEGRVVLRGPVRECSASFPDEAAPSQKSEEETGLCAQVRTGPSLCLTESGWKQALWIW